MAGNQFRFLASMLKQPGSIGAVAPTGKQLARAMANCIPVDLGLPVLELGPGTGAITKAILARSIPAADLVLVEYDLAFHAYLRNEFPGTNVLRGDAFDLGDVISHLPARQYSAVVSALPLLNFPVAQRRKLLRDCFSWLAPQGIFIQFSYGCRPPVAPIAGLCQLKTGRWIFANLPPARVYQYTRITPAPKDGLE